MSALRIELKDYGWAPVNDDGDYNEFINLNIHDNDGHGFYIGGLNVLIEGSRIYRNGLRDVSWCTAGIGGCGYGIQVRKPDVATGNFVIRNNTIYDNRLGGIVLANGGNHLVYNNVIYGNNGGILMYAAGDKIYNNTIVNNGYAIDMNSGNSSSVEIKTFCMETTAVRS